VPAEIEARTTGPDDTRALAAVVAASLRPGDVVSLTGELGAGKTCFVQGAAAALGVTERVTSPSFLLRKEYGGKIPILHLDVYRLETLQDVVEIGYDEVLDGTHVAFIEWGDAMSPLLPSAHLEIEFRLDGPPEAGVVDVAEPRRITVRARGDDWRRRFAALAADLQPWRQGAPAVPDDLGEGR
jgi:tRNA threonylcarbamoyladenosine biosynthesis protein TsaE